MCGIAGIIDKRAKISFRKREILVTQMLKLMDHRGGDANGVQSQNSVTMGHTRLSIVDTTSQANQPYLNKTSILSFNGEIYNHQGLRKKFLGEAKISSHSDTATLFALLNKYPLKRVLKEIQGMFAFSFFDSSKNIVSLVLDRHAIKPLYYVDTPDYLAWASEAKAFAILPKFKFRFQEKHLNEYLIFRYVAGGNTLFKDVYRLQPGEQLTYYSTKNSFKKSKYYRLTTKKRTSAFSEKILKDSVRSHLMGDITAGVQLSGGIDSSIVALYASKFSKKRPHTFSIGLKNRKWNEFHYSDLVAKKLKTNHHKIIFSKKEFASLLPKIAYHLDEPIVHPNTVPMYLIAKVARKYTKVLLTGEGADEVFYGYNRYFHPTEENFIFSNAFTDSRVVSKILKSHPSMLLTRRKISRSIHESTDDKNISVYDMETYLPHVLLRQDKTGMAANVENRVPFLHQAVVESGLNSKKRVGKYGGKNQIKKIALKYFSKNLVLRRKCGFGLPISEWLTDDKCLLQWLSKLNKHQIIKKYFIVGEVKKLINEHLSKKHDHSHILFTLVSLIVWYDVFINLKTDGVTLKKLVK